MTNNLNERKVVVYTTKRVQNVWDCLLMRLNAGDLLSLFADKGYDDMNFREELALKAYDH